MSRDSGAGAYSHGIAWPSPRPQLDGARWRSTRVTAPLPLLAVVSSGDFVDITDIIAPSQNTSPRSASRGGSAPTRSTVHPAAAIPYRIGSASFAGSATSARE